MLIYAFMCVCKCLHGLGKQLSGCLKPPMASPFNKIKQFKQDFNETNKMLMKLKTLYTDVP